MGGKLNIGSASLVKLTNRLERMRKSDLPVVVRQTLNTAAFNAWAKTMPSTYKRAFTVRDKAFLKNRSRYKKATGFNISSMRSSFGIIQDANRSTKGLALNETGGIQKNSFTPLASARIGNSYGKKVSKNKQIQNLKFNKRIRKGNKKKFIEEIIKAGRGKHILYGQTVYKIRSLKTKGGFKTKLIPLHKFKKGGTQSLKPRPFIAPAAMIQGRLIDKNFVSLARKRIKLR